MFFGISYWLLPVFAAATWFSTLLALLLLWATNGRPRYPSENETQNIPYLSDTAAYNYKPLFIAGSAVAIVVFDLAFISERWLRHKGRLAHNRNWVDKGLSVGAIIFAVVGAAALILLTIFDTYRHDRLHLTFLFIFIVAYIISAIFICAEYQRLGMHFREYKLLRTSFWIKLAFIFIEVALVIAFGVMSYQSHYNTAAVLEWTVCLFFILYMLSFALDFIPALHSKHDRFPTFQERDREMHQANMNGPSVSGGPVYSEQDPEDRRHNGVPAVNEGRDSYSSTQPMMYPAGENPNMQRAF